MTLRNDLMDGILVWLTGEEDSPVIMEDSPVIVLDEAGLGFSVSVWSVDGQESDRKVHEDLKSALLDFAGRI
jgi:hypothetical protein